MADAPTPGATRRMAAATAAPQHNLLQLRLRDQTLEVNLSLPLKEAFVVRAATGNIPIEQIINSFGLDSFAVLWWLARRQNGEPNLPWSDFSNTWDPDLSEDDIDLDPVYLETEPVELDSPEGDGPA